MRITVYDILGDLASGMSYDDVLGDFPYLTKEDILACLEYAADRERSMLSTSAWNCSSIKTSPRLIEPLLDIYPGYEHVFSIDLGQAQDIEVWEHARQNGFTIVSKDADFSELSMAYGSPPKVIWIRRGNLPYSRNWRYIAKGLQPDWGTTEG